MVLYEDANQKLGHHKLKNNYWQRKGIIIDRTHRLFVGDYAFSLTPNVVVDTKQNLLELASNFFCDKKRFEKECIKAKMNNIILIFLVEEKFDKEKLLKWTSPKNVNGKSFINVNGKQIYEKMKQFAKFYNCKFRFCHKNNTGRKVIELLKQYEKQA